MLETLSPDVQHDIISFVEHFKDVCSIALVSKDMRLAAAPTRRSMVEDRQLRVQCGRCLHNFRAPGVTLEDRRDRRPWYIPGWHWHCPTKKCAAYNEVSRAWHDVVERPGWDTGFRRMQILHVGQKSDFVLIDRPEELDLSIM
jgi:hypothetical protein